MDLPRVVGDEKMLCVAPKEAFSEGNPPWDLKGTEVEVRFELERTVILYVPPGVGGDFCDVLAPVDAGSRPYRTKFEAIGNRQRVVAAKLREAFVEADGPFTGVGYSVCGQNTR